MDSDCTSRFLDRSEVTKWKIVDLMRHSRYFRLVTITLRWSHSDLRLPGGWQVGRTIYHRFRWYATLEKKTLEKTFPKFPSILSTCRTEIHQSQPVSITREGQKVTLVNVIGGFRADMSITRKIDGNFGNVSASVLFSKVAYRRKRW